MFKIDPRIKIRAFRAVDDKASAQRFLEGHQRVLEVHGVKQVTSVKADWIDNPGVFVLLVESFDGEKVYGGSRVHAWLPGYALPIEEATGYMDETVYTHVRNQAVQGTGELCGLWNSIEVAGLGVGSFLATRAGVAICQQIGIQSLFALCAPYTVQFAERVGCTVLKEVGNEGTFYYPKLDLLATTVLLRNTFTVETAIEEEREKIMYLRANPTTVVSELTPRRNQTIEIHYDLSLNNTNQDEFKHPL
jgi:hypothetical protein